MINHELKDLLMIKNTCCLAKVDYRKFKCASDASMDDNVNLIKGIFYYFHLDWKTHNKFQAPAAEIPLEDPQVVTEDNKTMTCSYIKQLLKIVTTSMRARKIWPWLAKMLRMGKSCRTANNRRRSCPS